MMRAFRIAAARLLPGGLFLPLVLVLVACSTSPTDQLSRAEKLFSGLESQGADQYLTFEMAEIRRQIEEAKKAIRCSQFDAAGQSLVSICQKLDSCAVVFLRLRSIAESRSRQQLELLTTQLAALETVIAQLPRQSYVDQNRHDIHVHRLRRFRSELKEMEVMVQKQLFPQALLKANYLAGQVAMTFAGLSTSPQFSIEPARQTQARPGAPPPEEKPRIASMMAASVR